MNVDLSSKKILITGASSGLGEHFAHVLSQSGADIGIMARRETNLNNLAGLLAEAVMQIEIGRLLTIKMELAERELGSNQEIANELEKRLKHFVEGSNTEAPVAEVLKQQLRSGKSDASETLYEILQLVVAFKLGITNPAKLPNDLELRLDGLLVE
ncbi:MAG: SDR family NAD(P)-dependent oxidoreductase [Gammaproteobacteria bacterium]|nr:SDR family NAD(P)-dependent oxidoreductase [Gammaproteobacteria bacterium]